MSHSTTKTSTYIITKYSRAYPVKRHLARSQLPSESCAETVQEWQHFTNPTMRLLLDLKIASNKELESVRLRIIWSISPTVDAEVSQQDVVFEDMDLLSFSSITAPVARKHQTEGLPLKAVYRDTVVGIRYLHGREDGITSVYRRFQISLLSASDASEFVALIKPVCPCRLNPTSAPSFAAPQTQIINAPLPRAQTKLVSSNSLLPNRGSPFVFPFTSNESSAIAQPNFAQPTFQSSIERPTLPRSFTLSSSPLRQDQYSDEVYTSTNSNGPHSHQVQLTPSFTQNPIGRLIDVPRGPTDVTNMQEISSSISDINATLNQSMNLPSSSLPSIPSSETSIPNTVQVPASANISTASLGMQDTSCPIFASFVEAASIYNLSDTALEQVIAEIINEDGFIQLVEKISEMTIIRRVANV